MLAQPPTNELAMVTVEGKAQGTTYHIMYRDQYQRNFKTEIDRLLAEVDKCLSTYRDDSEIAHFNRTGKHVFERPYFYAVLDKSARIFKETGGAFDPTVMPLVEAYGFGRKKKLAPEERTIDSLLQYVGFQYVSFSRKVVRARKPNVRLDFNSIAQGYSVDLVAAFLEEKGVQQFLVEIGGEIKCKGTKSVDKSWVIGIENPLKTGELQAKVKMRDRAMATAGNYRNHYVSGGKVYNHIINPKTGRSEPGSLLSVTVFAPDAISADAYDTPFFVMGLEKTIEFLSNRKELDAYLIYLDESGRKKVHVTDGLKKDVVSEEP